MQQMKALAVNEHPFLAAIAAALEPPRQEPAPDGLTAQQAHAYAGMLEFCRGQTDAALMVLEGFAGVGKSHVVGKLVADLQAERVIGVAAPTNKAVKVLASNLRKFGVVRFGNKRPRGSRFDRDEWDGQGGKVCVGTLHSFLGLQMQERDDGTQQITQKRDSTIHDLDVLVVDEASMVGTDMFKLLLRVRRDCLILFVGDPAQLPPVEKAGVGMSPVFSHVERQARLTEVVRQAQGNPMIALSMVIRRFIEAEQRMTMADIMAAIPRDATAIGAFSMRPEEIAGWAVSEIREGRDCRVLAFRNATVEFFNRAVHEALYGPVPDGRTPFDVGEPVIVHSACDADKVAENMVRLIDGVEVSTPVTDPTQLHTSQELTIKRIERDVRHRYYPDVPERPSLRADLLYLDDGDDNEIMVHVAHDPDLVARLVSELFTQANDLKRRANDEMNPKLKEGLLTDSKGASGRAWAMKNAFAPIRHAYAITVHKSQGSTFDTALVDYRDLNRMVEAYQFNRALYVACTRASQFLAICA
ncbi:UvrD-like helicase C-terminal domain-containing protein [Methylomagnum ishizawai]|uniref:UvrD-like helicase C-terminal domain-containing protein n=1 Tax=Methylomagnum ishizawai TaxID=1760988 RepID=A0A1Y6D0M9_9GAMM|nr:DEAD/DEAH box helicase [Methylomagnum ishizawai]SMF93954.1 UvrD-like helicase C-terminal domain-containing protein [Methylomagnum ishizawai]